MHVTWKAAARSCSWVMVLCHCLEGTSGTSPRTCLCQTQVCWWPRRQAQVLAQTPTDACKPFRPGISSHSTLDDATRRHALVCSAQSLQWELRQRGMQPAGVENMHKQLFDVAAGTTSIRWGTCWPKAGVLCPNTDPPGVPKGEGLAWLCPKAARQRQNSASARTETSDAAPAGQLTSEASTEGHGLLLAQEPTRNGQVA